ncbi:MAG: T9SS type A sorting domain-containing protein [Crocinitomicaceae bacterium]
MNRHLFILFVLLFSQRSNGQLLQIPDRDVAALQGSQVVSAITSLSLQDRELYIKNEVLTGNVPMFYRDMIEILDSALIGGSYKYITYYVIPDYLALGSASDYFLCPMTPILAQQLADSTDCILPTRKMVNRIWYEAAVKMNPESIPPSPQMTTVPVFNDHNTMVWTQRQTFLPNDSLGFLVSGDKKDVVISNQIYTSPPPDRVVIYGWHYPNGTNIQPLYAGHISEYADYSHGIRLVQNQVWVDGVPMLASDVLADATLYPLLSDEGVIAQPYYPDTSGTVVPSAPSTPKSFALINEDATTLRLKIAVDNNVDSYKVYTSTDGSNFSGPASYTSNDILLSGLTSNTITYIKISASNVGGTSNQSEVLAATPTSGIDSVLIVNGFDRNSAGNTKNFIRQHGQAILNYGAYFSSATNDAVLDGLVDLNDYRIADYILGEESTADETFSASEQVLVSAYLDQGGYLFVSGAEIGWDLDHLGSATDQQFYSDYLKAEYVLDAPNDQSATYYQFVSTDTVFQGIGTMSFDNGTNGTYNVDYPDVINGINGGTNGLLYSSLTDNYAGVYFHGLFPNGSEKGKLVYFGFPFETVYPQEGRDTLMRKVMEYFEDVVPATIDTSSTNSIKEIILDIRVYPNPTQGILSIDLEGFGQSVELHIYNSQGKLIFNKICQPEKTLVDITDQADGLYLFEFILEGQSPLRKRVLKK